MMKLCQKLVSQRHLPHIKIMANLSVSASNIIPHQLFYVKNIASGISGIAKTNIENPSFPAISGPIVVWQQTDRTIDFNYYYAVYYKNLSTGATGRLTRSIDTQLNPAVYGTKVLWTQITSSGHYAIYLKDLTTGIMGKLTP